MLRKHEWAIVFALALTPAAIGQSAKDLGYETGEQIFQATCAGCHGPDGKGQPQHILGFEPPATFPDFTDCSGSSRESDQQWSSVIHQGGRARGFSLIMPSFGPKENPALTDDEIQKVIKYVRTFCDESTQKWPSGDFNVPRPLYTEKAFPEDEQVFMNQVNLNGGSGYTANYILEKRFGPITNMEFRFRGNFLKQAAPGIPQGRWQGAMGDTTIEYKRSILVNNRTKSLIGWGSEILVPTGNHEIGGTGAWELEQFLTYTQILPNRFYFLQQVGAEGPFKRHDDPIQAYARTTIGKTFLADRGFGRAFSLASELITTRNFASHQNWTLSIVPQAQITVSQRQHMRLGIGVNLPVVLGPPNPGIIINPVNSKQLSFYWLWDHFDGGFFEGWKSR
jgi:mono/diheme cytochrome c family protein